MEAEIFYENDKVNRGGCDDLEGFMTLDEAEQSEKISKEVFEIIKQVQRNVVRIRVPVKSNYGNHLIGRIRRAVFGTECTVGTGFVFAGPSGKVIMTNYHVIKNHEKSEGSIRIRFFFDTPDCLWKRVWNWLCRWLILRPSWTYKLFEERLIDKKTNPSFFSKNGVALTSEYNCDNENKCDFVVYPLTDMPDGVGVCNLEASESRHDVAFDPSWWKFLFGTKPATAIIIGHPRGSHKRISIVDLHPCDNKQLIQRCYTSKGTRPGSSGSPVIINCKNAAISPEWVFMLHFASGFGINILPVLDSIRQQLIYHQKLEQAQNATQAQLLSTHRFVGMDPEICFRSEQIEEDSKFKTLDEARRDMSQQIFDDTQVIFRNVVQIISGTQINPADHGTGLVFIGPGGNKQILTYYNVIRRSHRPNIIVKFFYDEPNDHGNECCVEDIVFYSKDGRFLGDDLDEHLRFFAILSVHVDEMPPEIGGISFDPATGRLNNIFGSEHWNDSPGLKSKGVAVGHPLGGLKRISFVSLHDGGDNRDSFRCYSSGGTLPGSCGSPIVVRSETSHNLILHYGPGFGCHISNLIQAIYKRNADQ